MWEESLKTPIHGCFDGSYFLLSLYRRPSGSRKISQIQQCMLDGGSYFIGTRYDGEIGDVTNLKG
jgi:hypothetical protein